MPYEIASRFVSLVSNREWVGKPVLPREEIDVLSDLVRAAGFNPGTLQYGSVRIRTMSSQGNGAFRNTECPYHVLDKDGTLNWFASGWLDCALSRVRFDLAVVENRTAEKLHRAAEAIAEEIRRSIPFPPIRLTEDDEYLCEPVRGPKKGELWEYFVDHLKDTDTLKSDLGIHQYCNGLVRYTQVSPVRYALYCERCHLRIKFYNGTSTYGQLREELARKIHSRPHCAAA
jgi:hypothetical protein